MNKILAFILCIPILFLFRACTTEETVLNNPDLIFDNSVRLTINSYSYIDSVGKLYTIQGDTIYYTKVPDTLNAFPVFCWNSVGPLITTVALFTHPISVTHNSISNTNDIIWQWHSGMEADSSGYIQYAEGKTVSSDSIWYNSDVLPLESGTYYWVIWGWNSSATEIFFSSREMKFYVP